MSRTRERIVIVVVIIVAVLIWRHQFCHKQSKATALQMLRIQAWSERLDAQMKSVLDNQVYLHSVISPPIAPEPNTTVSDPNFAGKGAE